MLDANNACVILLWNDGGHTYNVDRVLSYCINTTILVVAWHQHLLFRSEVDVLNRYISIPPGVDD